MTKIALNGLVWHVASRWGPEGVRANAVVPGSIRTPIWDRRLQERPGLLDSLRKWYPVGRVGRPDEIADMAIAMLRNGYLTNKVITLDGGIVPRN